MFSLETISLWEAQVNNNNNNNNNNNKITTIAFLHVLFNYVVAYM